MVTSSNCFLTSCTITVMSIYPHIIYFYQIPEICWTAFSWHHAEEHLLFLKLRTIQIEIMTLPSMSTNLLKTAMRVKWSPLSLLLMHYSLKRMIIRSCMGDGGSQPGCLSRSRSTPAWPWSVTSFFKKKQLTFYLTSSTWQRPIFECNPTRTCLNTVLTYWTYCCK